jgi:hypothetical protein
MQEREPLGWLNIRRALMGMPRGILPFADELYSFGHPEWVDARPDRPLSEHERSMLKFEPSLDVAELREWRIGWESRAGRSIGVLWDANVEDMRRIMSLDLSLAQRLERDAALGGEAEVRSMWIWMLLAYGDYEGAQFDIEVPAGAGRDADQPHVAVRADIVIYRDVQRTHPGIVIEVKDKGASGGYRQAESYARNLGAEFFAVVRGGDYKSLETFRTGRYGAPSQPSNGMPGWAENSMREIERRKRAESRRAQSP